MNFLLATVYVYSIGTGIRLVIDGETTRTTKWYMHLSSYSPSNGDRVLVLEIAGTYIVLGKVVI